MKIGIVALTLSVAIFSSAAFAGVISSTTLPVASGPGLGLVTVPGIFTINQNNDNQTGGGASDNNVVIPLKRFDSNNFIDIEFTVTSTDGITEYKVTEFVDNNTGVNWSSYKMQLGTGTGGGFTPFTTGNLDFDAPNYDAAPSSSGALTTVGLTPYELTFSGGTQSTGAQQYIFRLDIPDGGNTFTLRQIPTGVPEPGAITLLGLALAGVFAGRRQR